jgi:hypothetical protein
MTASDTSLGLDLAWFPEQGTAPEVDFVATVAAHRIPLEVKYRQHIDAHRDTLGFTCVHRENSLQCAIWAPHHAL